MSRSIPAASAPAPRTDRRRRWLIALVVLAVLAAVAAATARGLYRDGPLEPDAPTPQGSRAVVEVLEDLGVEVETHRHTTDVVEDLREGSSVLVTDPNSLSSAQLTELGEAASTSEGNLVLVQPDFVTLSYLSPSIAPAGSVRTPTLLEADPGCGDAAFGARRLQVPGTDGLHESPATTYRLGPGAQGCFGEGESSLVAVEGSVVVLGSPDLLTNEGVGEADNPALALNSLGSTSELTWYVPSPGDPMASTGPDLLSHLPDWAAPVALWILVVTGIALLALARRFGPVVVEPLPVTVRAQELVLGRARMLQKARARDAAAASLRAAGAVRLADRLGIRHEASLDALIPALAPYVSATPAQLRTLLGPTPLSRDQDLVQLAHDLDVLEKEIDR